MMMMLVVFALLSVIKPVLCVLPAYTPATQDPGLNVQEIIRAYFLQGYSNYEILRFLAAVHGVTMGLRTVKRWLQKMSLKRANRRNEAPLEDIVAAILDEMEGSVGSFVGYRDMTRRLRLKHNLTVRRDHVMRILRVIDPEGVLNRQRRRLQRRKYSTPGPNFLWHIDGWDKLRPYGFYVHGCVDGFSRRILWLEVGTSNKDSNVVLDFFLSTVDQLGGVPRLVRTDQGTENVWISVMQRLFRRNQADALAQNNSFIQGKSSANQRIEAYWSKLRHGGGGWWMNFFKDLRDSGTYQDHDPLQVECLRFCFMPVIRKELYWVAKLWNTKNILVRKNSDVLGGKPDVMFFTPEVYSTSNYLIPVEQEEVEICRNQYAEQLPDCSDDFARLVHLIYPNGVGVPESTVEALSLFKNILGELHALGIH